MGNLEADPMRKCESPIEQMLMDAIRAKYPDDVVWLDFADMMDLLRWYDTVEPFPAVIAVPQLTLGRYRADFVFIGTNYIGPPCTMVAVECDGHEYHERTKEQAARDRKRDRYLIALEVIPMRFTGQEIFADASACAREIYDVIRDRERESERTLNWYKRAERKAIGQELLEGGRG